MNSSLGYDPNCPSYDLEEIKELLQDWRTRHIAFDDLKEATKLGYPDDDDIIARVCKITKKEFHKTMPSEKCRGLMQDVYYTYDVTENGRVKIYVKLQIRRDGKGVVISFKKA